jgi:hypothetical protein
LPGTAGLPGSTNPGSADTGNGRPAPTGAEIELTVAGLSAGERCVMVAVSAGGSDIAGTWNATYDGMARVAGTSAIPVGRLTALRIESGSGHLLLNIPV